MVRSFAVRSLILLSGLAIAFSLSDRLSAKHCEDLGFTGLALCSDCSTFAEYVKDEELVSDCLKCCSEDSDNSLNKATFSGAILEVCMRKLGFYPEVVAFIEEDKDEFGYVKVQYAFASPPKLIMLDSDGHHKETIRFTRKYRSYVDHWMDTSPYGVFPPDVNFVHLSFSRIDNWKRDHIRQFLKEKVKPTVAYS